MIAILKVAEGFALWGFGNLLVCHDYYTALLTVPLLLIILLKIRIDKSRERAYGRQEL